jgi:hypothetical protein
MRSEQARIGARVRVSESGWRSEWWGLTGTISAKWGNPEYLALDVRLQDGRTQLFWHHELQEIDVKVHNRQDVARARRGDVLRSWMESIRKVLEHP